MHPLASLDIPIGKVAIHWFEQSSYAFKDSAGTLVFVDPYFPRERPAERFVYSEPPLDEAELAPDFVLLTHNHGDHTCIESLMRIHASFPGTRYFGPVESAANIAQNTSIPKEQVQVVTAGDSCELGSMIAHAVYAKAPEGDPAHDIAPPDVTHLGYVVDTSGGGLYFTGDVFNCFAERDDLVRAVADRHPDVGFLTNHPAEGEFPFFDGCARMAAKIGLKTAVPAHYECFVKRNYDPNEWAEAFSSPGPQPLIIPRNSCILYPE